MSFAQTLKLIDLFGISSTVGRYFVYIGIWADIISFYEVHSNMSQLVRAQTPRAGMNRHLHSHRPVTDNSGIIRSKNAAIVSKPQKRRFCLLLEKALSYDTCTHAISSHPTVRSLPDVLIIT